MTDNPRDILYDLLRSYLTVTLQVTDSFARNPALEVVVYFDSIPVAQDHLFLDDITEVGKERIPSTNWY